MFRCPPQNCMQYISEPFSVMHLKNSMRNTLTQYHVKSSPDMEHASVPRRSLSTSPGSRGRRAAPSRTCPHTETPLPVLLLLLHMAPGQRGRKGTRIRLPLERVCQGFEARGCVRSTTLTLRAAGRSNRMVLLLHYSRLQKKIYKVSIRLLHILGSPPISVDWRNMCGRHTETL